MDRRDFLAAVTVGASAMAASRLAASERAGEDALDIREVDGVPMLWESGLPYFTRFSETSHDLLDLSGVWKFMPDPGDAGLDLGWHSPELDDSGWHPHPVPGSWNAQKEEWLDYEGAGWYRTRFKVPAGLKGRLNRLVFDGVAYRGLFYLNGKPIGYHSGGFSRFCLEVSGHLKYGGENSLAIRVDNRRLYDELPALKVEGGRLGWWFYGGIHRRPFLESGPLITLAKLAVDTDHQGGILVQGVVYNHGGEPEAAEVRVGLSGLDRTPVAELGRARLEVLAGGLAAFRFEDRVPGIRPWSPEQPGNRYRLKVQVSGKGGEESQGQEIGFRKFEFRGLKAYLNDRPVFLRGINRHEDFPDVGPVQTDHWINTDLALLKELQINFMRPAHYPHDPRWLDACDRAGIMIVHEIPHYQLGAGPRSALAVMGEKLYENAARQLIETIERDRNHPCTVMWSIGNENKTFLPWVKRFHHRLIEAARRFDNQRPVTFALSSDRDFGPIIEITGALADALFFNEYFGWYGKESHEVEAFLDQCHEKWPDKPIVVSEFGGGAWPEADGSRLYDVGSVYRDFTEDYQAGLHQTKLDIYLGKPYITGTMPWVFADFRDDKRPLNPIKNFNLKGLVTYDRGHKKKAFSVVKEAYQKIKEKTGG